MEGTEKDSSMVSRSNIDKTQSRVQATRERAKVNVEQQSSCGEMEHPNSISKSTQHLRRRDEQRRNTGER